MTSLRMVRSEDVEAGNRWRDGQALRLMRLCQENGISLEDGIAGRIDPDLLATILDEDGKIVPAPAISR